MSNPLVEMQKYGQSIWYDNIRRGLFKSGELQKMVDNDGLLGITSNPAIFEKAIAESHDYDDAVRTLVGQGVRDPVEIYERLAIEDIQSAADVLRPVYERTGHRDGYVSFEVSPFLAHDTAKTIEYAKRVHKVINRKNILIKIPGTPEGMPAITSVIGDGISVNVTLLFAVEAYEACAQAYIAGLEKYAGSGRNPGDVASVASFFVSRIDTLVDQLIDKALETEKDAARRTKLTALKGKVAVANAIVAYDRYKAIISGDRWKALAAKGAHTQRVLWASTSTKNKAYPKTKYVDELIAPDTVNTIPEETFDEYRSSGHPAPGLAEQWDSKLTAAQTVMRQLGEVGISMKAVTDQLLKEGVDKFSEAFDTLLKAVEKKRDLLHAA